VDLIILSGFSKRLGWIRFATTTNQTKSKQGCRDQIIPTFAGKLQLQLSLLDSTFEEETTEQKTNQKGRQTQRHRDTETWLSVHSKNGSKGLKTITLDWSRWNQLSATTAA